MTYREEFLAANPTKKEYLEGLYRLISERNAAASDRRLEYAKEIFHDPDRYRADLCRMLGWPLVDHKRDGVPNAAFTRIAEEDAHVVYRASFEILSGVKISGLYFEAKGEDTRPLVLVQHGGLGSPELIAGFYGSTSNYNDMLTRVTKHGVHVFAPQLLLWEEGYEIPFERKDIDGALKRVGSSISAIEIFGLVRILDYFETQPRIGTIGMVGMSYGGFYTLFTAALDTRIRAAVSCAFFNTRDQVAWSDWTWQNAADRFDDAEVAALVYPRHLCIQIAESDPLFSCPFGVKSFERLRQMSASVGTDWVDFIIFEGKHEFNTSDLPIEDLIRRLS